MISRDLLHPEYSLPSVYFQLDVTFLTFDEIDAELVSEILKKYSVSHVKNGNNFNVSAQKITLAGDDLVTFLAILHDVDVDIEPKIRLQHMGQRRFDIYRSED